MGLLEKIGNTKEIEMTLIGKAVLVEELLQSGMARLVVVDEV